MVNVGSVWVKLGIKSTLGKDAKKAENEMGKIGKSAERLTKSFNKIGTVATAAGTALTIGLTVPILKLGKAATTTAANVEGWTSTLDTLYGSTVRAGKEIVWLTKFAQKTPFQLPGLITATKRLKAFGIEAQGTLGTLGDTAAAMGTPIIQTVEALADAQTGEFERLKEFGIKAIQITNANYAKFGKTQADVGQTALSYLDKDQKQRYDIIDRTNQKVITETLLSIWNSKYAGAMAKQSKTLNGIASNIKDNFTVAGLSILGFDKATGQFKPDSLFEGIKSISEKARDLSESFANLNPGMQKFIAGTAGAVAIGGPLILTLGALALSAVAIAAAWTAGSTAVVAGLGMIIPVASTVILPLAAIGGVLYGLEKKFSLVSDTAVIAWDSIKKVGAAVKDNLTKAFEGFKKTLNGITEAFKPVLESLAVLGGPLSYRINKMLEGWHERAEAIRQKNQEVNQGLEEQAGIFTEAAEGGGGPAPGPQPTGPTAKTPAGAIPGYAGHTRELIEAGMPEQAGFINGMLDGVGTGSFDLSAVQPKGAGNGNKGVADKLDRIIELLSTGNAEDKGGFNGVESSVKEVNTTLQKKNFNFLGTINVNPT